MVVVIEMEEEKVILRKDLVTIIYLELDLVAMWVVEDGVSNGGYGHSSGFGIGVGLGRSRGGCGGGDGCG